MDFAMPGRFYCRRHNEAVLAGLLADAKVDRVLIISRASSYVGDAATAAAFEKGLGQAVRALASAGKAVWLLDPVPNYGYPVPAALAQLQRRGQDPASYGMEAAAYLKSQAHGLATLQRVAGAAGAQSIATGPALCGQGRCAVVGADGRGLYMDDNHLNMAGARLLAERALRPLVQDSR
jgi:hypothetical protein